MIFQRFGQLPLRRIGDTDLIQRDALAASIANRDPERQCLGIKL